MVILSNIFHNYVLPKVGTDPKDDNPGTPEQRGGVFE